MATPTPCVASAGVPLTELDAGVGVVPLAGVMLATGVVLAAGCPSGAPDHTTPGQNGISKLLGPVYENGKCALLAGGGACATNVPGMLELESAAAFSAAVVFTLFEFAEMMRYASRPTTARTPAAMPIGTHGGPPPPAFTGVVRRAVVAAPRPCDFRSTLRCSRLI